MGAVETVVAVVAVVAMWGLWSVFRSKIVVRTQFQFTCMVDALEEGDIERAAVCERVFNEISGNALRRFNLEELVRRLYVKEQDVIRIHALNRLQDE